MAQEKVELPRSIVSSQQLIDYSLDRGLMFALPRLEVKINKGMDGSDDSTWERSVRLDDFGQSASIQANSRLRVALTSIKNHVGRLTFLAYQTSEREVIDIDPKLLFGILCPLRDQSYVRFDLGTTPSWVELYLPTNALGGLNLSLGDLKGPAVADSVYSSINSSTTDSREWGEFVDKYGARLPIDFRNAVYLGIQDL